MIQTDFHLSENELHDVLLPRLIDNVFHVTRLDNLEPILKSGEILPGKGRNLESSFGYQKSSFFHARECVSLFDYRNLEDGVLETSLTKCSPFQAIDRESDIPGMVIFFLSPLRHDRLLPWTLWKEEQANEEMVVPHVEVGYRGPISLDWIDEIFRVVVKLDQEKQKLLGIYRRARAKGASDSC
jgi:hypothetical protein